MNFDVNRKPRRYAANLPHDFPGEDSPFAPIKDVDITPGKAEGRIWGYSGPGDWLGKPPVIDKWDEEKIVDVVVVGSGNSGVQAALAAAECGAKVAVLEKMTDTEHYWYGEDMAAYNSKLQLSLGLGPYNIGEIVDEYCTRSGGRVDPEIIRLYVANSGETMDHMLDIAKEMNADPRAYTYDNTPNGWLILQMNMDYDKIAAGNDLYDCFNKDYPMQPGTKTWAAAHQFMGPYNDEPIQGCAANSVLSLIQQACVEKAMQLGAQWYMGTPAVVLVQNGNKVVTGVIAQEVETGKYIKFNARKGVVMAGGDYGANAEMSWSLMSEYMERRERCGGEEKDFVSMIGGRDGSSVKMLCWAGGYVEPAPRGTMIIGGGPTGPWGTNCMLWLNKNGERFTNEGNLTSTQSASARQPKGIGCLVTDKKWLKAVCACGVEHGGPNAGRPQWFIDMIDGMNAVKPGPEGGLVKICTIAERGYEKVIAANTLEELAEYLGYEKEAIPTFVASVRHYNELCYKGEDSDFGKGVSAMIPVDEVPFYGVVNQLGFDNRIAPGLVTMSGVLTDRHLNVIDINKKPIKGLYTCGNSLGGRYGTGYSTPTAGNSIGMACTHGRIAGQNVCK